MSLRMVEMVVPEAAASKLASLAEDLRVLGLWREQLHDEQVLLRLLVPSEKTEAVIAELEKRFERSPGFRLVIFEVQATVPTPEPEEREKEPDADTDEQKNEEPKDPRRIAVAELVESLSDAATINRIFLVTVFLSTVVATIGLIRDNVAVIIGAMVIAPLLGPNMTLALATTLGDGKLARNALRVNAAGLALALALSTLIGIAVPVDPEVREIAMRTEVSLSDIALALAAGSAGALAFTTGLSTALVGVMVAVALLPPLATVGLLLGSGHAEAAHGALLLTVTNIVCINLAGVATFLWQRVNPRHWWQADRAKRMVRLAAIIWLAVLALLASLIIITQQ
jgi:uncharacterized hydrophobic protein (TIGR00341 family)